MQQIPHKAIVPHQRISPVYSATWKSDKGNIEVAVLMFNEITDEQKKLAQINHPHIMPILGYSINGLEEYCLLTPQLTTRHLATVLYSEITDLATRLDWAYKISLGLMTLHANTLMHLNLTTRTVVFNKDNQPVLIDLHCMLPNNDRCETLDTLPFRSPEQLLSTTLLTSACDAYSFATVLWCCFTQRKPMANKDREGMRFTIAKENQCEKIPEETPPHLASLIKFCWAKDPAERKTAEEISKVLFSHRGIKG